MKSEELGKLVDRMRRGGEEGGIISGVMVLVIPAHPQVWTCSLI